MSGRVRRSALAAAADTDDQNIHASDYEPSGDRAERDSARASFIVGIFGFYSV